MLQISFEPGFLRLILAIVTTVGLSTQPLPAQPEQVDKDLLDTARRGWKEYEQEARKWSLRVKSEFEHFKDGKETYSAVQTGFARGNGRCFSLERTLPVKDASKKENRKPETKPQECLVYGKESLFWARKEPGRSKWTLTNTYSHDDLRGAIERGDMPAEPVPIRDEIETEFLLVGVSVENILVRRLIDHDCCQTVRFAPISPERGALVEWRFTIDKEKEPDWMHGIQSGRVLFDPGSHWVIRESRLDNTNGLGGITVVDRKLDYQPGPNGFPTPTRMRWELATKDRAYTGHGTRTFENVTPKVPLTDEDFTRKAYGLTEK